MKDWTLGFITATIIAMMAAGSYVYITNNYSLNNVSHEKCATPTIESTPNASLGDLQGSSDITSDSLSNTKESELFGGIYVININDMLSRDAMVSLSKYIENICCEKTTPSVKLIEYISEDIIGRDGVIGLRFLFGCDIYKSIYLNVETGEIIDVDCTVDVM